MKRICERFWCAWTVRVVACTVLAHLAMGCATDAEKPQPLNVAFNDTAVTPTEPVQREQPSPAVSETVRESVVSPAVAVATRNSIPVPSSEVMTIPTTHPVTGVGMATTLTLGSVVVEVNGTPIFTNKVLNMIAPALAAKAKEMDAAHFQAAAVNEIQRQVQLLIIDEVVFATAQRNLDKQDQRIAEFYTARWRDDQIRRFGGSLQLARQAAAQQGVDWDEVMKDRYRLELRRVYFQKKEMPKIQIAADDMRHYYQRHLSDQFTDRDQAQFRVIKIAFKPAGGRAQAKTRADDVHSRAARGDDFSELAASFNDDPYLKKNKGDPTGGDGWIDRGAYANTKLEDAVWKLNPDQVTEPVEGPDAFYIAKLERKKMGRVKSFDEDAVQQQIHKALEAEQFAALRSRAEQQLRDDAIVFPDPPLYGPAIEMAMQMYPQWANGKK